jgi:tetratricopeptide (TPR) repeat protein
MGGIFSTELKEIEELIVRSEYKEALKRIDKVQRRNELTKEEGIRLKILKAKIYLDIQPISEALIHAKQAYEESVKADNKLLIFDSAIPYARSLSFLGFAELAVEKRKRAIEVLTGLKDNKTPEYMKRKAKILTDGINIHSEEYMDKLNQALDIYEEIGDEHQKAWILFSKAWIFFSKGDFSNSEKYYNQGLKIFTELNNIVGIIACTTNIAAIFLQMGELDKFLRYSLKALSYAEELDSSYSLGGLYGDLGFYYWQKGELETSLQYYKKSLEQIKRGKLFGNIHYIAMHFRINLVYLEQEKFEEIKQNLEKMEIVATLRSFPTERVTGYPFMHIYKLAQSIYLKECSFDDSQDLIETMLKEIVQEKYIYIEMNRLALFHLCDFYLRRLKLANDLELLEPLRQTLDQLDELAEKQKSSILLAETYMLKSHLAQIELNIEEAKVLLEKAQQIADEKGITRLATLISNEYDLLLDRLDQWVQFSMKLPDIAERMELTNLEDMLNQIVKNKIIYATIEQEEEQPSLFLIMDESKHIIFSDSFSAAPLDDELIEGIMESIHESQEEKEQEGITIERLRYKDYTIALYVCENLLFGYVFIGKSYVAIKKFKKLINDLNSFSRIWKNLKEKIMKKQELTLIDRSQLSEYIESIFL